MTTPRFPTGLAALAALAACACATPRLDDPPLAMEIMVVGLRQDERLELRDRVCAVEGVSECLLVEPPPPPPKKSRKKDQAPPPPPPEARITFTFHGSLGNLRWRISQLPHPGLEAQRADVRLSYRGFDNKAPSVEIVEPAPGFATPKNTVRVAVRIPDVDLADLDIGDEDGVRDGELFSANVGDLHEGENTIVIKATDQAGNVKEASITVVVDTVGPELEVEVLILSYDKAVVRGKTTSDTEKLTIDGRDVNRDLFGSFEKEVAVDPDKALTEIVASDAHGNVTRIKRSVKIASPMGNQSK